MPERVKLSGNGFGDLLSRSRTGAGKAGLDDAKGVNDDLNAATGLHLPKDSFDTVGGWVLDLFGRVPNKGEKTQAEDVTVTVEKVERTRVVEVLIAIRGGADKSEAA